MFKETTDGDYYNEDNDDHVAYFSSGDSGDFASNKRSSIFSPCSSSATFPLSTDAFEFQPKLPNPPVSTPCHGNRMHSQSPIADSCASGVGRSQSFHLPTRCDHVVKQQNETLVPHEKTKRSIIIAASGRYDKENCCLCRSPTVTGYACQRCLMELGLRDAFPVVFAVLLTSASDLIVASIALAKNGHLSRSTDVTLERADEAQEETDRSESVATAAEEDMNEAKMEQEPKVLIQKTPSAALSSLEESPNLRIDKGNPSFEADSCHSDSPTIRSTRKAVDVKTQLPQSVNVSSTIELFHRHNASLRLTLHGLLALADLITTNPDILLTAAFDVGLFPFIENMSNLLDAYLFSLPAALSASTEELLSHTYFTSRICANPQVERLLHALSHLASLSADWLLTKLDAWDHDTSKSGFIFVRLKRLIRRLLVPKTPSGVSKSSVPARGVGQAGGKGFFANASVSSTPETPGQMLFYGPFSRQLAFRLVLTMLETVTEQLDQVMRELQKTASLYEAGLASKASSAEKLPRLFLSSNRLVRSKAGLLSWNRSLSNSQNCNRSTVNVANSKGHVTNVSSEREDTVSSESMRDCSNSDDQVHLLERLLNLACLQRQWFSRLQWTIQYAVDLLIFVVFFYLLYHDLEI
ncbi:unnamed protein product [Protopolystoma xenopodis]|uniref:Uncharacterized protein n=1 Tax=Protopolystoma xenopodis TaxID=117903 RepID=A0A3S5CCH8_9PLAT|nr:unnamed protein product [Protopolystoma xenopodis]